MKEIRSFTQRISYAILETTGCHVTIANKDLIRIAGTGEFEEKIGMKIPWNSAFERSMLDRKTVVIDEPRNSDNCKDCKYIKTCGEEYEICTPIMKKNKVIGVIAIIATTIKQKKYIKSKKYGFIDYLENMAMLLSSYINEHETNKEIEIKNQELQTIIEKSLNATICISVDKKIKYINEKAINLFGLDKEKIELGETKINSFWENSNLERAIKIENQDTLIGEEIYLSKDSEKQLVSSQITKIYKDNQLVSLIGNFNDSINLQKTAAKYRDAALETSFDSLIGESSIFISTKEKAKEAAKYESNILITAEPGTGKELFARSIHESSKRRKNPFVTVNCSAIPESLLESEIFGYEKGITGIENFGKIGKMELSNHGTFFLDEIGEMTLYLQNKLLRFLKDKKITRVGGSKSISLDLMIICSSKKNLEKMVQEGTFLEELYYRISVVPIKIPSLRERVSDIEMLANYFLRKNNKRLGKNIIGFEKEAIKIMKDYSWPGNIRELENVVEYVSNFKKKGLINKFDISRRISVSKADNKSLDEMVKDYENKIIRDLLDQYGTTKESKQLIADKLKISRATLYRKLSSKQS